MDLVLASRARHDGLTMPPARAPGAGVETRRHGRSCSNGGSRREKQRDDKKHGKKAATESKSKVPRVYGEMYIPDDDEDYDEEDTEPLPQREQDGRRPWEDVFEYMSRLDVEEYMRQRDEETDAGYLSTSRDVLAWGDKVDDLLEWVQQHWGRDEES